MNKCHGMTLGVLLSVANLATAGDRVTTVTGYVSHGINVYNNQFLVDYSGASPSVPWLNPDTPIKEIGVLAQDRDDADVITDATDRTRPVATIRSFFDAFNPDGDVDSALFNQPLDAIGTNYFGYQTQDDRVPMVPFETARGGEIYAAKGTIAQPTVGDWDRVNGQIRVSCRADDTASAVVTIRHGFPNAVYTLWDIGALNPLTDEEEGYGVPFGGLPNIVLTDARGCGVKRMELAQCPTRPCEAGADSCVSYISAFYHWDAQVYGGAPAGTFSGVPVGAVASNHIVWPMSGVALSEPQNPFKPSRPGCKFH